MIVKVSNTLKMAVGQRRSRLLRRRFKRIRSKSHRAQRDLKIKNLQLTLTRVKSENEGLIEQLYRFQHTVLQLHKEMAKFGIPKSAPYEFHPSKWLEEV